MTIPRITPETKVAELLEHWPDLEPVLIAQAPAFQKLRNPVLRRTVARVASLAQAAAMAGISARDLVITLRKAAGQAVDDDADVAGSTAALANELGCVAATNRSTPAGGPPARSDAASDHPSAGPVIDADAMLEAGEVPLKAIFDAAGRLAAGDMLTVWISFRPVPLMERLANHGFDCDVVQDPGGRLRLSITRQVP
jgi:hypothetical protein